MWKVFSGDQLGTLLAAWTLEGYKVTGGDTGMSWLLTHDHKLNTSPGKLAMVASTVSSKMLEAMAQKEGFTFVESLTGMPRACSVACYGLQRFHRFQVHREHCAYTARLGSPRSLWLRRSHWVHAWYHHQRQRWGCRNCK